MDENSQKDVCQKIYADDRSMKLNRGHYYLQIDYRELCKWQKIFLSVIQISVKLYRNIFDWYNNNII